MNPLQFRKPPKFVLRGGLGNQLFGVLTSLWMKSKMGVNFRLDISGANSTIEDSVAQLGITVRGVPEKSRPVFSRLIHYALARLRLLVRWDTSTSILTLRRQLLGQHFLGLGEYSFRDVDKGFLFAPAKVVDGFLVGCDVFEEVSRQRSSQSFKLEGVSELWREISPELDPAHVCGIHLRAGDFFRDGRPIPDVDYFSKAIEIVSSETEPPRAIQRFVIFSDSPEFARSLFEMWFPSDDFFYLASDKQTAAEALSLLASCKAIIGSYSTFSWWAIHLRKEGSVAVAPDFKSKPQLYDPHCSHGVTLVATTQSAKETCQPDSE